MIAAGARMWAIPIAGSSIDRPAPDAWSVARAIAVPDAIPTTKALATDGDAAPRTTCCVVGKAATDPLTRGS